MKKLSDFLYAKTNIWICLILTGFMVAYAALVMGSKSECFKKQLPADLQMLDVNFSYDLEYAKRLFSSLDAAGLQCYLELVSVWDTIFPVFYGAMYLFWVSLIFKGFSKRNPKFRLLNLFPFIPIIIDWCENISERNLVLEFMQTDVLTSSTFETTLFFTQLKWATSSLNYLLILTGIAILAFQKLKKT